MIMSMKNTKLNLFLKDERMSKGLPEVLSTGVSANSPKKMDT
jgi:hypothetical protein